MNNQAKPITMRTLSDDLRGMADTFNDHFTENAIPSLEDYGYEKSLSCAIRKGAGDIVRDIRALADKVDINNALMHGMFKRLEEECK